MKLLTVISAVCTLLFSFAAFAKNTELISQQDFLTLQQSNAPAVVLDVRSAKEFDQGHIAGAINISHDIIEQNIAKLEPFKDQTIVVYCRSGRRAGLAEAFLAQQGFTLKHLEGDMNGWQSSKLPVVENK